jgi:hypothetical protein
MDSVCATAGKVYRRGFVKRFVMIVCCLLLVTVLAAQPFATAAQDATGADDYVPLILGDNVFSLLYPSKWAFSSDGANAGTFVFASDLSILKRQPDQPYAKGEIVVALDLLVTASPVINDDGLEATLKQFLDTTRYGKDKKSLTTFNPSIASLIPATDGAPGIVKASYSEQGHGDGMIYLWRINDRVLGMVTVNTAVGEVALQEPDVLLFIQSVRFNATPEAFAKLAQQGSGS